MPKGISLNIGLNSVSPAHYGGWSGDLTACEADAEDMAAIAAKGFAVTKLLTKAATRAKVAGALANAAKTLKAGDIFLLSYSGHGGQLPDKNNDEDDGQDETWCLYDGEMVDDELNVAYAKFAKGVRILVFSDSCHSGTVTKAAYYHAAGVGGAVKDSATPYRFMPPEIALRTYRQNQAFYDRILKNVTPGKAGMASVKASVLLISGCQDNQLSADGDFNGLFTANLLRAWDNGNFKGGYKLFHKQIVRRMPPDQTPNYFMTGAANPVFEKQTPFKV